MDDNYNSHATHPETVVLDDIDLHSKKLALQFISTKIMSGAHQAKFWHAFVRNLKGQEFYIDLGNYGAVFWEGTYNPSRWLTLKDTT